MFSSLSDSESASVITRKCGPRWSMSSNSLWIWFRIKFSISQRFGSHRFEGISSGGPPDSPPTTRSPRRESQMRMGNLQNGQLPPSTIGLSTGYTRRAQGPLISPIKHILFRIWTLVTLGTRLPLLQFWTHGKQIGAPLKPTEDPLRFPTSSQVCDRLKKTIRVLIIKPHCANGRIVSGSTGTVWVRTIKRGGGESGL